MDRTCLSSYGPIAVPLSDFSDSSHRGEGARNPMCARVVFLPISTFFRFLISDPLASWKVAAFNFEGSGGLLSLLSPHGLTFSAAQRCQLSRKLRAIQAWTFT